MAPEAPNRLSELPELRGRTGVFAGRRQAGDVLAGMLADCPVGGAIVLAIPAGGVPVGAAIARRLGLPLDVAVVSKITPRWNSEVGYGAVAFDGTVRLNESLLPQLGLTERQIREDVATTSQKVRRRVAALRGQRAMPDLTRRTTILVDDGLASGFTMQTAVEAVRKAGAQRIVIAVPTAHGQAVEPLLAAADAIYCANVRGGWSFAVADAYRRWRDVDEAEAAEILAQFAAGRPDAPPQSPP